MNNPGLTPSRNKLSNQVGSTNRETRNNAMSFPEVKSQPVQATAAPEQRSILGGIVFKRQAKKVID